MPRLSVTDILQRKACGEKITVLTAYDYPTARALDDAGVDIILVGDSLGMVILGYDTTLPVTVDDMVHHAKAVVRGSQRAFITVDMPFLSYQVSVEEAVRNAGRLIRETGAQAVKLEGGREIVPAIKAIVGVGIPVMGHLGLTPQAVHQLGGFKVQGKDEESARRIMEEAILVEKSGAFSLVLESVPQQLARIITGRLRIPTIGIGAGPHCDGQVLVTQDMLGMFDRFVPKFVRQYARLYDEIRKAVTEFSRDVRTGSFPGEEHSFNMSDEIVRKLEKHEISCPDR